MDFTREPIIETVITPKEGCKLVIRSSKSTGQEEYFVDAVEVVSFGNSFFFRSLERPKAFLVPVSDYEVLEVREARMVLKNVGLDRAIKIAGGREGQMRGGRETAPPEKPEPVLAEEGIQEEAESVTPAAPEKSEMRLDKKRDRRRHYRRRRGREEPPAGGREAGAPLEIGEEKSETLYKETEAGKIELPEPKKIEESEEVRITASTASFLTSLLPPPPNLISETIARYKDNALFKQAFYLKEDEERDGKPEEESTETVSLEQPAYGSFEVSEEEEEEIYHQRKRQEEREKNERERRGKEENDQPPLESKDEVSNNNLHP